MPSFTIKAEVGTDPRSVDDGCRHTSCNVSCYDSPPQITPASLTAIPPQSYSHPLRPSHPPPFPGMKTSHLYSKQPLGSELAELFSENIIAKIYRTAVSSIAFSAVSKTHSLDRSDPSPLPIPQAFPEYVPQHGTAAGDYHLREPEFWTCGFFPGSLYGVLERLIRFPQSVSPTTRHIKQGLNKLRSDLLALCELWAEPLHDMALRTDTHDVGFMVMPALRLSWELTANKRSLDSITQAAHSLASRYVPAAKAIRSWDERVQKNIQITCQETNLVLIIDSLCNLDLLYYAASHCPNDDGAHLYNVATSHATTLLHTHLRLEEPSRGLTFENSDAYSGQWYSTYHVANLDPRNGTIKKRFTAQGYSDNSTWARGQAWAILGYAQTYMWTKDRKFLQASCGLAEYFLHRLERGPAFIDADMTAATDHLIGDEKASARHHSGRFVPLWDFDSPMDDAGYPIRDSSAGAIAANGMLILSQALAGHGHDLLSKRFRNAALDIARDLVNFALAPEKARFATGHNGELMIEDVTPKQFFEALLKFGTANNNENAKKRYANHGLVYGDYYFVELGNRILRMGLD